MAVTLKKQKEDEDAAKQLQPESTTVETKTEKVSQMTTENGTQSNATPQVKSEPEPEPKPATATVAGERGRRLGKEVAQVRVVGFDGINQDELNE